MKKIGLKKLSFFMVLILGIMFSNPAMVKAATDANTLYANAYNAVVNCKAKRTQESINTSRSAIIALKGTDAAFAIGEFSKQTDEVQQELFVKLMNILFDSSNKPKDSLSQAEINEAKELIFSFDTYEGNKPYTSSWSSAVDPYQQKLIDEAVELVEKAKTTRESHDIESARVKINTLLTAKNNAGVVDYANKLLLAINAIVPKDVLDNNGTNDPSNYVIAGRAGHNMVSVGASSSLLDESTETRNIFATCASALSKKTNFIDCTPYYNPSDATEDLEYGINKAKESNANLFFSVHLNIVSNTQLMDRPLGAEIYVYDANSVEAIEKANKILSNLESLGFLNRGVKYNNTFKELKENPSSGMIIECFFIDSKVDVALYKELGSEAIGLAIANGIDNKVSFTPSNYANLLKRIEE